MSREEVLSSGLVRYLRGWIAIVGIIAFGNTVSCFRGHEFLAERLYTVAADQVNDLSARLFGTWTLLSAFLRISCAFSINNAALYNLTLFSFALAFVHFASEVFLFKAAQLTMGVLAPLIISGISMIWMIVCYKQIFATPEAEAKPTRMTLQQFRKQTKSS